MTEMQKFALRVLCERNYTNPKFIAARWAEHKGYQRSCASRDMFGLTSAAYRALRALVAQGLAAEENRIFYPL